jgi:hypothetical protein
LILGGDLAVLDEVMDSDNDQIQEEEKKEENNEQEIQK